MHGLLLKLILREQLQKYDRINKSVLKGIQRHLKIYFVI
jgi:hypothetical protein